MSDTKQLENKKAKRGLVQRIRSIGRIGNMLDIPALREQAFRAAAKYARRVDVPFETPELDADGNPTGKMTRVAKDLADTQGRWMGTTGGFSISGYILIQDILLGSTSAAAPVLAALTSAFAILGLCIAPFAGVIGATDGGGVSAFFAGTIALLTALCMFATVAGYWLYRRAAPELAGILLMMSVIAPAMGVASMGASSLLGGGGSAFNPSRLTGLLSFGSLATVFGGVVVVTALGFFAGGFAGGKSFLAKLVGTFRWIAAFGVLAGINTAFMPAVLQPLLYVAVAACAPMFIENRERYQRAMALFHQSRMYNADVTQITNVNPAARAEQAAKAEKDKSGFIPVGIATGVLTAAGDNWAPDADLPMGLSVADMSTHIQIFGATGTGKTFSLLNPIMRGWVKANGGGVFLMDGKADMPLDILGKLRNLPNVLLIDHNTPVALLEGVSPNAFISAIADEGIGEGGNGNGKFFADKGRIYGVAIANILHAIVDCNRQDPKMFPGYTWTVRSVMRLCSDLDSAREGEAVLSFLESIHPDAQDDGSLLTSSINEIRGDFWLMADQTKSSVKSTFTSWLTPITQHPDLAWWGGLQTGVNVSRALTGDYVGIVLPYAKFGKAGLLCQKLLKARLFTGIRLRSTEEGKARLSAGIERPTMFMMDEAQELIGKEDVEFLAVARSLGGYCVYATQNVESYIAAFGEDNTFKMLGNFRSKITYKSTTGTEKLVAAEFGDGVYRTMQTGKQYIDYVGTAAVYTQQILFDANHPNSNDLRRMARKGVGMVYPFGEQAMPDSHERHRKIQRAAAAGHGVVDSVINDHLEGRVFEIETGPLVNATKLATWLNQPRTALATFQRAGGPRRDFMVAPEMSPDDVKAAQADLERDVIYNAITGVIERDIRSLFGDAAGVVARKTLIRNREAYIDLLLSKDAAFDAVAFRTLTDDIRARLVELLGRHDPNLEPEAMRERQAKIIEWFKNDLDELNKQQATKKAKQEKVAVPVGGHAHAQAQSQQQPAQGMGGQS